jgi:pyruvate dehydrogenase E2 component (dihydrolipoamide acetyltransferase)
MEEGTIARWLKQPGDTVKKGDVLAEIETDKATMDLESFDAGVLEEILAKEGQTIAIGQAIAILGDGSGTKKQPAKQEDSAAQSSQSATTSAPEKKVTEAADLHNDTLPTSQPSENVPQGAAGATSQPAAQGNQNGNQTQQKVSPLARRLAEEYNIDLNQVKGTGPSGRIVRDDIEDYREKQSSPQAAPAQAASAQPAPAASQAAQPQKPQAEAKPDDEIITLSRMQNVIARRLTASKQSVPHFYVSNEVDMTDLIALRQTLNGNVGEGGIKVSINDLIIKASALALEKHPNVNSSFAEGQFIQHKRVNVGMAVDISQGLVVPVIKDANIKGVRSIAREARALIDKAKAGRLSQTDLEGGTFSVSNLGMLDVTEFIAVINPPESAILAIASVRKTYVPINDQPVVRDLMTMTLSSDHRILYGAAVARFLQEVKRLLEHPFELLG